MAFTDHKITAFTHKISDLADQPNLPPDELKARFDACPEELRQAVNAICDDAARLDTRVDGIITGSFSGAVSESMLAPELTSKLNGKADQSDLDEEAAARVDADSALDTRLSAAESTISAQTTAISGKCQISIGAYIGNGAYPRTIGLGFKPRAVLVSPKETINYGTYGAYGALITTYNTGESMHQLTSNGFTLQMEGRPNHSGVEYCYIAFR